MPGKEEERYSDMQKRAFVFLLLVVAALFSSTLYVQPTYACDCIGPSPQGALQGSDAVLTGKVLSETQTKRDKEGGGSYIEHDFLAQVLSTYKGVETQQVHVFFATDFITVDGQGVMTICDRPGLLAGETYFIYAYSDNESKLAIDNYACSRTTLLVWANEDKQVLGPGRLPREAANIPGAGELGGMSYLHLGLFFYF